MEERGLDDKIRTFLAQSAILDSDSRSHGNYTYHIATNDKPTIGWLDGLAHDAHSNSGAQYVQPTTGSYPNSDNQPVWTEYRSCGDLVQRTGLAHGCAHATAHHQPGSQPHPDDDSHDALPANDIGLNGASATDDDIACNYTKSGHDATSDGYDRQQPYDSSSDGRSTHVKRLADDATGDAVADHEFVLRAYVQYGDEPTSNQQLELGPFEKTEEQLFEPTGRDVRSAEQNDWGAQVLLRSEKLRFHCV